MSDYVIRILFQYNLILAGAGNMDSVRGEGYMRGADASCAEKETEYSLLLNSPKKQRWREMERTANGHTSTRKYHSRSYSQ
jgi:hypothetical protein